MLDLGRWRKIQGAQHNVTDYYMLVGISEHVELNEVADCNCNWWRRSSKAIQAKNIMWRLIVMETLRNMALNREID